MYFVGWKLDLRWRQFSHRLRNFSLATLRAAVVCHLGMDQLQAALVQHIPQSRHSLFQRLPGSGIVDQKQYLGLITLGRYLDLKTPQFRWGQL